MFNWVDCLPLPDILRFMSIVEVAKLAGCSHTTVSRVINQKPGVSADAAARVQAAMRKLSYIPPVRRRGPQPKQAGAIRTGNVALLMIGTQATPLTAPVSAAATQAVEQALGEAGYSMTLSHLRDGGRLPSVVSRSDIDGLILHGNPPSQELADQLRRFPVVWIMSARSQTGYWGDRVAPDNDAIGRIAAQYLIDRGHRHIAFLYVDATHRGFPQRAEAYCRTAGEAGVGCEIVRLDEPPAFAPEDFRAQREHINGLIDRFAAMLDRPTGLFVPRGQTTLMVFEALRSRGIEPGRGVTVIACDNDPILAGLTPQIATVDVRPDRIGRLAVQQLIDRINKPQIYARNHILVEPSLVEVHAGEF